MRQFLLWTALMLWAACARRAAVPPALSPAARAEALVERALPLAAMEEAAALEHAVVLLDSALDLAPAHYDAMHLKAVLLDDLARTGAATATYHALAALRPYDPVLLRTVGCHHLSLGQVDAATSWLSQAEALFAGVESVSDSLPWAHLVDRGTTLMLLGRTEVGRELLDRAFATAVQPIDRVRIDHLRSLPPALMAHALLPGRSEVVRALQEREAERDPVIPLR